MSYIQPISSAPLLPTSFTLTQLMAMNLPEQQFIVPGILPVGLTLLAGKPKLGKSWLALQLALSVATGQSFLNKPVAPGEVLYLALEDSPQRLQRRTQLLDYSGQQGEVHFCTTLPDGYEDRLIVVADWLQAHPGARCVIIDVWGRFMPELNGKDEYGQITRALQPLQVLAHAHGVALVLVHHAKKGEGDGSDTFDQVLGSTALTSNADATLMLTRHRNQTQATLHLTGRDVNERSIPLSRSGVRWDASQSTDPPLPPAQQEVLSMVGAGHHTAATIAQALGKQRTAVQNTLQTLLGTGLLRQDGRGQPYYLPDQSSRPPEETPLPSGQVGDMTDKGDTSPINPLDLI